MVHGTEGRPRKAAPARMTGSEGTMTAEELMTLGYNDAAIKLILEIIEEG